MDETINSKSVPQCDAHGWLVGYSVAYESPREPGVYLIPAGCTEAPAPTDVPPGTWPRWAGDAWLCEPRVVVPPEVEDPVAKLRLFLLNNPDVAALLA